MISITQGTNNTDNEFYKEIERLESFNSMQPTFSNKINGHMQRRLALYGFYYANENDNMKCAFCNIVIRNWNCDSDPLIEHITYAKHVCPLIRGFATCNQPLRDLDIVDDIRQVTKYGARHPHYRNYGDRLATFTVWPKGLNQKPEQLAEVGFFYTQIGDNVKCFYCGNALVQWLPTDDPFVEHFNHFKDECDFITNYDGTKSAHRDEAIDTQPKTEKRIIASQNQLNYLKSMTIKFDQLDKATRCKNWKIVTEALNKMQGVTKSIKEWQRTRTNMIQNSKKQKNKCNKTEIEVGAGQNIEYNFNQSAIATENDPPSIVLVSEGNSINLAGTMTESTTIHNNNYQYSSTYRNDVTTDYSYEMSEFISFQNINQPTVVTENASSYVIVSSPSEYLNLS